MASTFWHTGGLTYGLAHARWPLAVLTGDRDALRLTCLGRYCVFPRARLGRLCRHKGLLFTGLRIEHSLPDQPARIIFWPRSFAKLKANLASFGYPVQD